MSNLIKLLPVKEFTTAELHELSEFLNKPSVHKYLLHLQAEGVRAIGNGMPKEGESAEHYIRRQAMFVGSLATLETLLSIDPPARPT